MMLTILAINIANNSKMYFYAIDVELEATTSSSTSVVGRELIIYCDINATLQNITATVNLKLKRNNITIYNWNRFKIAASNSSIPTTKISRKNFVISMLSTNFDSNTFQCEAIINATSILKIASSFLLKVTGELLAMYYGYIRRYS